jgi:hypothetical protein
MPNPSPSPPDRPGSESHDDADDPEYRAALLTGRARAVEDMAVLVKRLALPAQPEADSRMTLEILVSHWFEVVSWLDQAAVEAVDELALLRQETGVQPRGFKPV